MPNECAGALPLAMIPQARFTRVAGAGHLMHEDAPENIVAAILKMLR